MNRTCAMCGSTVSIDKENSNRAIQYKKRFYHCDCFNSFCDQRIANQRKGMAERWTNIKNSIDELIIETTREQRVLVSKDELVQWLFVNYDVSLLSTKMYTKLDGVYCGTYRGLAYPIGPEELLAEWKYYWDELCAIRRNKNLTGEQAVNYDLAIVLGKNAEYRKIKEKEKIAREIREQQMNDVVVNISAVKAARKPKNKVADLYQELNGGVDNE